MWTLEPVSNNGPSLDAEALKRLYGGLLLIRRAEERLITLFADGEVPGFIHLSIGQEAVSVGIMANLGPEDTIASTHRGHGHALAKGLPLDGFFAELLGKEGGLCKGRGGSMHVADMSIGMLGANGIVGAGLSIALGSALAHKTLGRDAVAVAFFGDAAAAEGLLHESLNLAALLSLPILFVCESNGWGEFLPTSKQIAFTVSGLAAAYNIPFSSVDGNDVAAVAQQAETVIAGIRAGSGPALLECHTHRIRGHYEGDAQKYRDPSDIERLSALDPIRVTAGQLAQHDVGEDMLAQLLSEVEGRVETAILSARESGQPTFESALADVYTPAGEA
jgi:TPP-dependent pyruvate/acetoin dehydrogenase alpha subunit